MGSLLGQQIDGKKLVFLFAILMIVVGVLMLRRRKVTLMREDLMPPFR